MTAWTLNPEYGASQTVIAYRTLFRGEGMTPLSDFEATDALGILQRHKLKECMRHKIGILVQS